MSSCTCLNLNDVAEHEPSIDPLCLAHAPKTAHVQVVSEVEIAVRSAGPQAAGEYWWDVYDVESGETVDSIWTETAGDEDAALETAVDSARDNFNRWF